MSDSVYHSYQALVRETTINDVTLLSTDYLNHFNEVVMLLEIVPDMPEMFEDVESWRPKSYQQHFLDSQFTSRDLAVEAYEFSPPEYREPFDLIIGQLNAMVAGAIETIGSLIATADIAYLAAVVAETSGAMRSRIDRAGAIINGSAARIDQDGVDAIFEIGPVSRPGIVPAGRKEDGTATVAVPDNPMKVRETGESGQALPEVEIPLTVALAFSRYMARILAESGDRSDAFH